MSGLILRRVLILLTVARVVYTTATADERARPRARVTNDEAIVLLNARLNQAMFSLAIDELVQSLDAAVAGMSIPVTPTRTGAGFEIAVAALSGFILLPDRHIE